MKKILFVLIVTLLLSGAVYATDFTDIGGLKCEQSVENLAYLGIINGVGLNKYAPEKNVTRAELSKMVVGVLNISTSGSKTFNDIGNHWGKEYIEKAATNGLLNGYEDGSFKPNNEITYAETVAILLRSLGYNLREDGNEAWYSSYIQKMREIQLNDGIESFEPNNYANRGDVAILLWNALKSQSNGKTLLEEKFMQVIYIQNEKVLRIEAEDDRVVYQTDSRKFYVDFDIDFSDLGGLVTGFIDKKSNVMIEKKMDVDKNYTKISGSTYSIKEMGYDTFTAPIVVGYGEKEDAKYMEAFIDSSSNKTARVVFYDTSASVFVEKIKVGQNKISVDSKDFFDESIIMHKGSLITVKILRTETVKDIDGKAMLIKDGKIVSWDNMPEDSVLNEIQKNKLYTCFHKYIDAEVKAENISIKEIKIGNKKYEISPDAICENINTRVAMKLSEALTDNDIKLIAKNDPTIRIYFNNFEEIMKIEFSYDVWKLHDLEKEKEEHDLNMKDIKKVGIISNLTWRAISGDSSSCNVKVESGIGRQIYSSENVGNGFHIGDLVYTKSGDTKITKIANNLKIGDVNAIVNYDAKISDGKVGIFPFNDVTEFVEIELEADRQKSGEYVSCKLKSIGLDDLNEADYSTTHLFVNKDNVIIRAYLIKTTGFPIRLGIIKDFDFLYSGDAIIEKSVSFKTERTQSKWMNTLYTDTYDIGDLVKYETKKVTKSGDSKDGEVFIAKEVYSSKLIGDDNDLIIKNYSKGKISFRNSDDIIDLSSDTNMVNGTKYNFNDYQFVNAIVTYDKTEEKWIFKSFTYKEKDSLGAKAGNRFVVDELSKVVVIYSGYNE